MKLAVFPFAVAAGLTWGIAVVLLALMPMFGWEAVQPFVDGIGGVYMGYESSALGALMGLIWGFIDAGIGGLVFVLIYNGLVRK